jgi:hypothetical protein
VRVVCCVLWDGDGDADEAVCVEAVCVEAVEAVSFCLLSVTAVRVCWLLLLLVCHLSVCCCRLLSSAVFFSSAQSRALNRDLYFSTTITTTHSPCNINT